MALKLFVLMLFAGGISATNDDKLKVSVFYETYCPCSSSLLSKQIYPAHKLLSDYIELDLVPYGQTTETSSNGVRTFKCKHGEEECYANKIHACAIAEEVEQSKLIKFVKCIVDGSYTEDELAQCATDGEMSWDSIKNCANSSISNYIISLLGDRTRAASLEHTPAILFNNTFDVALDEKARHGFLATVCSLLEDKTLTACLNVQEETPVHD